MSDARALPIFPLPSVVLFPGIRTPLHIFEPRYQQMTAHALDGDGRIGMVAVPPEYAAQMPGDPPVYPVGCAGVVSESKRLPDGRYNIVLVGTHRFRITEEPQRPAGRWYRVAGVALLDDSIPSDDVPRVAALRSRVTELLTGLLGNGEEARSRGATPEQLAGLDDTIFTNALCNALALPPAEKQGLLEAASVADRLARLAALLDFRALERASFAAPGSSSVH